MNRQTQQRHVMNAAIEALRRSTGLTAAGLFVRDAEPAIELKVDRRKLRFAAAVETADRFEMPALIRRTAQGNPPLLVAPYITRTIAAACREMRLPFVDTAGNAFLEAAGMLIYVTGEPRPPGLVQRLRRSFNAAGLQVIFALLCRPELVAQNYRQIAAASGVALGTVGIVVGDLQERGFVRTLKRGRRLADPQRLLREWVAHYPTTLRPKLHPRRFQADPAKLRRLGLRRENACWGGEVAADRMIHFLKPAHYTIYVREPVQKLVAAARMRAAQHGNVDVLDVFWHFAADPPELVPPVLAYADLLATNDGRNAEAAQLIYEERIEPTFHQAG